MQDKFIGCFLGLAFGDAMCAPYEGGVLERLLWSAIGKTNRKELRFTDDTQMSLDIARSFLKDRELNQASLAQTFANSYQWSRGYGPSAGKILKRIKNGMPWQKANISVYKNGSFGNGAAMRAPILAMCFAPSMPEFEKQIIKSAEITHSNALAIEGATLIAYSTGYAFLDVPNDEICNCLINIAKKTIFEDKLLSCMKRLKLGKELGRSEVKKVFGNGITAENSCVTAIYLALFFRDKSFVVLIDYIKNLGGDTDTIAAMSGAIWGAFNGEKKLQTHLLPNIEKYDEIKKIAINLHNLYKTK